MESDLELAFYSAISLLEVSPHLECSFKNFSSLKAACKLEGGTLHCNASEGFRAAPQEALNGLALKLVARVFRKKIPEAALRYVDAYEEFYSRRSTAMLNSSIRRLKPKEFLPRGKFFDLNEIMQKVFRENEELLRGVSVAGISWSNRLGKRVLAFHDESFNAVFVNDSFDSRSVPSFVLEYLVFHELLHAKHGALYQRGKSRRRLVHTHAFRKDEEKFPQLSEAEAWLDRNWRGIALR